MHSKFELAFGEGYRHLKAAKKYYREENSDFDNFGMECMPLKKSITSEQSPEAIFASPLSLSLLSSPSLSPIVFTSCPLIYISLYAANPILVHGTCINFQADTPYRGAHWRWVLFCNRHCSTRATACTACRRCLRVFRGSYPDHSDSHSRE